MSKYYSKPYSMDMFRFVRQYRGYGGHACLFSNENNQYVLGFMFSDSPEQPVGYIRRTLPETDNEVVEIGYIKVNKAGEKNEVMYNPIDTFSNLRSRVLKAQDIMRSIKNDTPDVDLTPDEAKAAHYFASDPVMLEDFAKDNALFPYYTILKEVDENGKRKKYIHLLRDGKP